MCRGRPVRQRFGSGDLVVSIVRRPDPLPCPACAIGEWDMCRNGRYTERGIKQRHGYAAERFRIEPEFAVKIDRGLGLSGVLVEPTSIVVKAWDQVDYIGRRSRAFAPQRLLVTGAGPIGLLAALIGAQRGLEVHVFNRSAPSLKTELVRELGAVYHSGDLSLIDQLDADIVMECSGAPSVMLALCGRSAPSGVVCLAGIANDSTRRSVDPNQLTDMVLQNQVMFGAVNANRNHYQEAAAVLERADPTWLTRLITRRVPIDRWFEAFEPRPGDIKTVLDFSL